MEENITTPQEAPRPKMGSAALGYAVILAIALIIYSLILYLVGESMNKGLGYVNYVILLIGIILAQLNFRDKRLEGFITYGQSFTLGFLTALFAGIIMAVYTYIFFTYISPGALDEALQIAQQRMMDKGMDDQQIEMGMSWARKFTSPIAMSIFAILGNAFIGLILSLIAAIFTKKENPQEFSV
jgi:hypothetical protein